MILSKFVKFLLELRSSRSTRASGGIGENALTDGAPCHAGHTRCVAGFAVFVGTIVRRPVGRTGVCCRCGCHEDVRCHLSLCVRTTMRRDNENSWSVTLGKRHTQFDTGCKLRRVRRVLRNRWCEGMLSTEYPSTLSITGCHLVDGSGVS